MEKVYRLYVKNWLVWWPTLGSTTATEQNSLRILSDRKIRTTKCMLNVDRIGVFQVQLQVRNDSFVIVTHFDTMCRPGNKYTVITYLLWSLSHLSSTRMWYCYWLVNNMVGDEGVKAMFRILLVCLCSVSAYGMYFLARNIKNCRYLWELPARATVSGSDRMITCVYYTCMCSSGIGRAWKRGNPGTGHLGRFKTLGTWPFRF